MKHPIHTDRHTLADTSAERMVRTMNEPIRTRRVGRTVLAVESELRSTLRDGAWSRTIIGKATRPVPNGNGAIVVQTDDDGRTRPVYDVRRTSLAPDPTYRVVALANSGRATTVLGHGMSLEQAVEYLEAYSPRYGLLSR